VFLLLFTQVLLFRKGESKLHKNVSLVTSELLVFSEDEIGSTVREMLGKEK